MGLAGLARGPPGRSEPVGGDGRAADRVRSARQFGVEVVEDRPRGVYDQHRLLLPEQRGIGMGDAGAVSDGIQGVEDGGYRTKHLCDVLGAGSDILELRVML